MQSVSNQTANNMGKKNSIRMKTMISMILMGSLIGCGGKTTKMVESKLPATPTVESEFTITPTAESESPTTTPVDSNDTSMIEELTYKDFSSFQKLADVMIPCTFESTKKQDDWESPYEITGSFDLNQDGTDDSILFQYDPESYDYQLQIGNATLKDCLPSPETFYIIDVDKRDSYTELVLLDNGMSCDPNFTFYRYDGTSIVSYGAIGSFSDTTISFDGFGRVTQGDSFLCRLQPAILPRYYQLEENDWKEYTFDLSDAINQEYVLNCEENAYFDETDQVGDSYSPTWSEEEAIQLSAGDKITIKGIYELEKYWVELPDGRNGMLYFWIGD